MVKSGNYTIAFLDILGFKEMVQNISLTELSVKYESVVGRVSQSLNYPDNRISDRSRSLFSNASPEEAFCDRYIFSDSIILFSQGHGMESCLKLLTYAWRLNQLMLVSGFPLRGAITYGEVYVNDELKIFLGNGLTSAYELEQRQQWIGVSIDESVFTAFPDLDKLLGNEELPFNGIFLPYNVPMKDGTSRRMRTLNWRCNLIVQKGTRSLFLPSNDGSVIQKQVNTLKYAEEFVARKQTYLHGHVPLEFQAFWAGDSQPPFEHGDEL